MIRLGALGDVVRTIPSLRALRAAYPDAHISWIVESKGASVLRHCDALDEVIEFPRERLSGLLRAARALELARAVGEVVRDLRRRRFDLVIDFHAILKSGLVSLATGAPERVSYARPFAREFAHLFANRRARLSPAKLSRYDRNAALIEYLALEPPNAAPWLSPGARVPEQAPRDFILIHPGSSPGTEYKRYRASGYAAFAQEMKRRHRIEVLVVPGKSEGEAALAGEIAGRSRGAARLAPGCDDLDAFVSLLARARLFVGSDSGPLHIATGLGIRAIQLIGATDPIENAPRGEAPWRQLRVDAPCSPCRRGCTAASCMTMLPHEWIVEAATELLGAQPAAAECSVSGARVDPPAAARVA